MLVVVLVLVCTDRLDHVVISKKRTSMVPILRGNVKFRVRPRAGIIASYYCTLKNYSVLVIDNEGLVF